MPVSGYTPNYDTNSLYKNTPIIGNFMAYYIHRTIAAHESDALVKMDEPAYIHRPDLLSRDVYGTPDLWWVFGVRNGWEDLLHDMEVGIELYIPDYAYLRTIL